MESKNGGNQTDLNTKLKDLQTPEGYEIDTGRPMWIEDKLTVWIEESDIGREVMPMGIFIPLRSKKKDLRYYERKLKKTSVAKEEFFNTLQYVCPHQYWTLVLHEIANDICDPKKMRYYYLTNRGTKTNYPPRDDHPLGAVLFDTQENAETAWKLLGDNISKLK